MQTSKDFIIDRINSGNCNGMENNKYSSMREIDSIQWIKENTSINDSLINLLISENELRFIIDGKIDNKIDAKLDVIIRHVDQYNFEYFTMDRCCCDGTLIFFCDLMVSNFNKILTAQTINIKKMPNDFYDNISNYEIEYIIGNFVLAIEHGTEFSTKEKPWMLDRFTSMLPITMNVHKKINN